MQLLFAEDEISMAEAVTDILTYHKYMVDTVYNGIDAYNYAKSDEYDGIILDIMMPGMNGLMVLEKLRKEGIITPVLLLTAKSEVEDRIQGLDMGADDYLPKPFVMGELLARVRAMLRRKEQYTPDIIRVGNVSLNRQNYELMGPEGVTPLSRLEYRLTELLMINKGIYLSTDTLFFKAWGYDSDADSGAVWVYLSNLRKKLSSIGADVEIRAKRGVGYSLFVKGEDNG